MLWIYTILIAISLHQVSSDLVALEGEEGVGSLPCVRVCSGSTGL